MVGGTPEQKKEWLGRMAEQGIIFAYGATEPDAGRPPAGLTTAAAPVEEDGQGTGYRRSGRKH